MKYKVHFILILLVILSSCNGFESLEIRDIKQLKFTGFKDNAINLNLVVPINNPNAVSIKIKGMDMKAYYKGKPLGYVTSDEKVVLKAKTDMEYTFPVSIKITNLMQGLSLMSNSSSIKTKDFSFNGTIDVKYLLLTRTYDIDENMLKQYLR